MSMTDRALLSKFKEPDVPPPMRSGLVWNGTLRLVQCQSDPKIGTRSGRRTWVRLHEKGGKLEIAQRIANNESACTTGLYDRRDGHVSLG